MIQLNNLKQQIDKYTVISFDIFDTLLLRPYVKPTDLFLHLEQLEQSRGFAQARIHAERKARKIHSDKEDITLDEIYNEIAERYKPFKQKELDLEHQVLQPNPEIKEIYDYAKRQGKRIIIVSDMYLPKQFLSQVLQEKGFTGFEKLYVSSEQRHTKYSGNLYKLVLADLNINVKTVLHIGDNPLSDKKQPETIGFKTVLCTKAIDKLFAQNPRAKKFLTTSRNNLEISILLGLLALPHNSINYWQNFGYQYAGPVIFGYMKWLEKQLLHDHINEIMFLARDGYTLEKVFNLIKKTANFKTHYFYAPRSLNLALNLNYQPNCALSEAGGLRACRIILKYYQNKDPFLQKHTPQINSSVEGIQFIEQHKNLYHTLAEKEKNLYRRYLAQFELKDDKIAMIDTVSGHLSAQKILISAMPEKKVKGYYWFTLDWAQADIARYDTQTFQKSHKQQFIDWNLMELFMTAPTPPVEKIENGQIVFKQANEHERRRIELYPDLSQGAIDFAKQLLQVFGKYEIVFSCKILRDWINILCQTPTPIDQIFFASVYHAEDQEHSLWTPLPHSWFAKCDNNWLPLIQKKTITLLGRTVLNLKVTQTSWHILLPYNIELIRYKYNVAEKQFCVLGTPLWQVKKEANKTTFYLFKHLPIISIKRKEN